MIVWIVEEYDYGEGGYSGSEILGVFSSRELAESFVEKTKPSWEKHWSTTYESQYRRDRISTLAIGVYGFTVDEHVE